MPDNFFRTILYSVSAVALGAAGIVAVKNVATGDAETRATVPTTEAAADVRQVSGYAADASTAFTQYGARVTDRNHQPVNQTQEDSLAAYRRTQSVSSYSEERAPTAAVPVASLYEAPEPMIRVGGSAIELTVPVHPQSGVQARVPVALALATDPAGLPPQVQEDARKMAMDFLENVADAATVAQSAQSASYYERWQNAASQSDRDFKMRYGRTAYVQMNQMVAQEAAAGVR